MRRRFLLASAGAITLAGSPALAAEPPLAPPPPPPLFTWTGIYLGGQIGYAWNNGNVDLVGFDPSSAIAFSTNVTSSPQGIIGGGHVGYNYQINQIVVGIEGNVDGTSLNNTVNANLAGVFGGSTLAASASSDIQGSIRGRLGVAFDRVLPYATAGVAFGGFSTSYAFTGNNNAVATINGGNSFSGQNGFSTTRTGWTIGGGIDYAVTDNWSIFAEYRYTHFGTISNPGVAAAAFSGVTGLAGAFLNATRSLNQNQVQVGFSYKFGTYAPAPLVAKY